MKTQFKDYIGKILEIVPVRHGQVSYSQEGEDVVLSRFFGDKKSGFYVDVGAHHPKRFSNTYFYYKKGWRGINIDAMPGSMALFDKMRPNDINIECPISLKEEELTFYIFNEPALNTLSKELAMERDKSSPYKLTKEVSVKTKTLESVLDEKMPQKTTIDFLSIDVEGLDFDVLQSLNLRKYSPTIILIEALEKSVDDLQETEINLFLKSHGYELKAKTMNTLFYKLLTQ